MRRDSYNGRSDGKEVSDGEANEPKDDQTREERDSFRGLSRRSVLALGSLGAIGTIAGGFASAETSTSDEGGRQAYYDVREYGAEGDGQTDDTAEIQAAIDDAGEAGGGVVFFPPGDYRITRSLQVLEDDNLILHGTGDSSAVIVDSPTETALFIGSLVERGFYNDYRAGEGAHHNKVVNLAFDRKQKPAVTSTGVHVEDTAFTTLESVSLHNHGRGIAVGVQGGAGIPAHFVSILECTLDSAGTRFTNHGFPDAAIKIFTAADIKIHDTDIFPTNVGIDMAGTSNAVQANQCVIGNTSPFDYGVRAKGDGFCRYISNSTITNAREAQISIEGTTWLVNVTGTGINADPEKAPECIGIDVGDSAFRVQAIGNDIENQGGEAIRSRGDTVTISDNTIVDNAKSGADDVDSIYIDGTVTGSDHVRVANNRIWSSADRYGVTMTGDVDRFIVMGNDLTPANDEADGNRLNVDVAGTNSIVAHNLGDSTNDGA